MGRIRIFKIEATSILKVAHGYGEDREIQAGKIYRNLDDGKGERTDLVQSLNEVTLKQKAEKETDSPRT